MKNYILNALCAGCFITFSLHAMDNQGGMMGSMMQHMKEVTEEDLLNSLNNQDRDIYQKLNPQQKALVLKAANQFSCRAHMQEMHQKMMQQGMNQQGMMNR
jgi:hypothetical protein